MFYIVGLGNPGTKYAGTRHNVGFCALEHIATTAGLPAFVSSSQFSGEISEATLFDQDVILLKPSTFMNNSGVAVRKLVPRGEERRLIVLYDDVDIASGTIKVSCGRGSGGHNGVSSVIKELGTRDFMRIRIGIAKRGFFGAVRRPSASKLSDHVLATIPKSETERFLNAYKEAYGAIKTILEEGLEKAMQKYN